MLLWANDFRAVFWVAVIPGLLAVALLLFGVHEPRRTAAHKPRNPISRENLQASRAAYWWVVGIGAVFTLARFSEAFLVLRAAQGGMPIALVPLVHGGDECDLRRVGLSLRQALRPDEPRAGCSPGTRRPDRGRSGAGLRTITGTS